MKDWRFAAFDDSFRGNLACIVGCVTAGRYVEGFLFDTIEVDGLDATSKITSLVLKSRFKNQLKCIFLSGITFGGFNIANIQEIFEITGIPVVVVMRKIPDFDEIFMALEKVGEAKKRKEIVKKAGNVYKLNEGLYIQTAGCDVEDAKTFIEASIAKGKIPEALRIAHLVASAIIHGESKGRT
jgi:hypothetical protein